MNEAKNLVIAIAGGSGSGKSTIAEALAAVLGDCASVVKQDWYVRPSSALPALPNHHDPAHVDLGALAQDLAALRSGGAVEVPGRYSAKPLVPGSIVIVEGELVLHDASVRAAIDHSIFLDAPADLRLVRRLRREARESGHDAASVLVHYIATVRPAHESYVEPQRAHAESVLDAASPQALDRAAEAMVAFVRPHLAAAGSLAPSAP